MPTRGLYNFALCFALLICATAQLAAQDVPDSRGRDFYLTFPPNFHEDINSPGNNDSLFIFIAATQPTVGNIAYRNSNGALQNRSFEISDISKVYTFARHWRNLELGSAFNGTGNDQNGRVARQSFHITADQDIAVYALNHSERTSDAMMVLPTDVLGTEYMVLSYNTDRGTSTNAATPSQFAIVAVEDNTDIVITPSANVLGGSTAPINVRLNSGNSYLLQADVLSPVPYGDLTGTRINATKPVAVFSGHQRSLVPVRSRSLVSRDYLLEQLPPIRAWGRRYVLTPFPSPADLPGTATDLYRVLAAYDNTELSINGIHTTVLQAGQIYEAPLRTAAVVEANKEILLAQYKRSSNEVGDSRISDPFMLVVPPVRQYLSSYLCINAQARNETIYHQQYMTIICPTSFTHTVKIDGQAVTVPFLPVPTSCYSYAIIPVKDGAHRVEAGTEIGIYLYGYGRADSYGYVGGMAFRNYTGEGGRIAFDMTPEFMHASPGDTIELGIHAGSLEWKDIAALSFSMELSYKLSWMSYAGTIMRGAALDSTWTLEVRETDGDTPGTKKTIITASGTTPVAKDGTIATLRMVLFVNADTLYSPSLSASVNGDISCVQTSTSSMEIGISQCVINLRPVHYTGTTYSLTAAGNAGVLHLRYGVGLEAETRIELFNSLGEHIDTFSASKKRPGEYEEQIDVSHLAAGAYFIRMSSGPYIRTLPIVLGVK